MKVQIQIQGVAKVLHEGNCATARLTVGRGNACPAANRSEYRANEDLQNIRDQRSVVNS